MLPLQINEHVELRLLEQQHAAVLFELIQTHRTHLDGWLRWSGRIQTFDDALAFIKLFETKAATGDGFHAGIWYQGQLVGGLIVHYMNRESNKTEIGYWLSADFVGKGLVTCACGEVITLLFRDEKMNRIEIQCASDNSPSRAVAERLGFVLEGVKRKSEWITSSYRDHALYSLLADEWVS